MRSLLGSVFFHIFINQISSEAQNSQVVWCVRDLHPPTTLNPTSINIIHQAVGTPRGGDCRRIGSVLPINLQETPTIHDLIDNTVPCFS
ncbi:hypothetical protein WG66_016177 [Moniliophthora roreri]|nr:hypothetical protein WG66_016177 [Moniliophthora roreri]